MRLELTLWFAGSAMSDLGVPRGDAGTAYQVQKGRTGPGAAQQGKIVARSPGDIGGMLAIGAMWCLSGEKAAVLV
jgi:hypothetical protein